MSRRGRASGRRARYLLAVNNARPHESIYTSVFDDGQTLAGINLSLLAESSPFLQEGRILFLSLSLLPRSFEEIGSISSKKKDEKKRRCLDYLILLSRGVDSTIFFLRQRKNSKRRDNKELLLSNYPRNGRSSRRNAAFGVEWKRRRVYVYTSAVRPPSRPRE